MDTRTKMLFGIGLMAVIGLGISIYSVLHNDYLVAGTFCNLDDTFSCYAVNRSQFASVFGIPVAWLGLLGYGFLLLAAWMKHRTPDDRGLSAFLLLASLGATLFSFYLTGIEAFVLRAWCILCITSQILILIILGLSVRLTRLERKSSV